MSFVREPLTEEEIDINNAIDMHRDALKDEMQAMGAAILLYLIGLILVLFSAENTRPERIGLGLFACGALMFGVNILLGFRTRKYRRQAKELVEPYMRRKALPFYQELVEMFADKPGVHLHLNENGSITVTDKRKQETN